MGNDRLHRRGHRHWHARPRASNLRLRLWRRLMQLPDDDPASNVHDHVKVRAPTAAAIIVYLDDDPFYDDDDDSTPNDDHPTVDEHHDNDDHSAEHDDDHRRSTAGKLDD